MVQRNSSRSTPGSWSKVLATMVLLVLSGYFHGEVVRGDEDPPVLSIDDVYWPMMGRDIYNTNEGSSPSRGLQDPDIKWQDTINSTSLGSVGADMKDNILFSGVARRQIRFIIDANNTHCLVRDGDTGKIAWKVDVRDIWGRITDQIQVAPGLMDTDEDDRLEVLLPVTSGNQHHLALFEPNITLTSQGYSISSNVIRDEMIWNTTDPSPGSIRTSSPMIHDVSLDGVEDIVIGGGNSLYAYHGTNGSLIWSLDIGGLGETISTPAVYPGTGAIRRIVVNSLPPELNSLRTTTVNYQGNHLKNITSDLTPTGVLYTHTGNIPIPLISDVTGDVTKDIIIPYPANLNYGRVVVYTYTLEEMVTIDDIIGRYEGGLAVADINSDSSYNILLQSKPQTTPSSMVAYRVFWDGARYVNERVWTRSGSSSAALILDVSPMTCDINEDGVSDVVFPSPGMIYGILSDGTHYWNLSITGETPDGYGMIGDLSSDEFCDLYLNGRFISQKLIDLRVKDPHLTNIYLNDPDPIDGNPVTLNCIIENTMGTEVTGAVVKFTDLDSLAGEEVIGYDELDLVDTAEASVIWTPNGDGDHRIRIELDPDGNITEIDEDNNQGMNIFTIGSAYPDLTIVNIGFARGDGQVITDKHLVLDDPSSIIVEVENIGQKPTTGAKLRVNVDGGAPTGGEEFTTLTTIGVNERRNITVDWTPQRSDEALVEAWIQPPSGESEISDENNYLSNITNVKGKEPTGSLYIQGLVTNTEGEPESDVRMTVTIERTGEGLGPIQTGNDGLYGFDMNFINYWDGDTIIVRASKDLLWGENQTKVYSEDVVTDLPVGLTDIPTLSLFLSPMGDTDIDVVPDQTVNARFNVENDGNIPGNVTITKTVEGNGTLKISDVSTAPSSFSLGPDSSRQVEIELTVPEGELPGSVIIIRIECTLTAGTAVSKEILYRFTVEEDERLLYQMISEGDVILGPDSSRSSSFEFYLYNRGNVRLSYQMSVSSSLEDYVQFRDGSGELDLEDSASPFLDITLPNTTSDLQGTAYLSTSGLGTIGSWEISLTLAIPNVQVSGVISTDPTEVFMGDEITLIATIENSGSIALGDIECSFYDGDVEIGSRKVPSKLDPGEEASITGITWTPSSLGEHVVSFRIDPLDKIEETNEEDNIVERTFTFAPDISIKMVEMDSSFKPGMFADVRVTVENEGNGPLTDGFMISVNSGSKNGDQLISNPVSEVLDPRINNEHTFDLKFKLPDRSGNLTIFFTVSTQNNDGEDDISDNWLSRDIDLKKDTEKKGIMDYLLYIVIAVILILVAGAAFYVWKYGLPIAPPPGDADEPSRQEQPGIEDEVSVSAGSPDEVEEGPIDDDVMEMSLSSDDEDDVPVLEMDVVPDVEVTEESVIVAEVVEVEEITSFDEAAGDDEEEMIPEV